MTPADLESLGNLLAAVSVLCGIWFLFGLVAGYLAFQALDSLADRSVARLLVLREKRAAGAAPGGACDAQAAHAAVPLGNTGTTTGAGL
nr:hypothetical protein [uncultured Roseateles sp.]